jgi:hypothetical protein
MDVVCGIGVEGARCTQLNEITKPVKDEIYETVHNSTALLTPVSFFIEILKQIANLLFVFIF